METRAGEGFWKQRAGIVAIAKVGGGETGQQTKTKIQGKNQKTTQNKNPKDREKEIKDKNYSKRG